MAKTDFSIPDLSDKFIDLRDKIPGDAFNWSWIRSLLQIKYLAIHHSASSPTQTPQEIANYHIYTNGWGGIGYHFLISSDGMVYYVGDISTARANVANLNDAVLGICLIGDFTSSEPTEEQIESLKKLCQFFIDFPEIPNIKSMEDIFGHKELPGQLTSCPGDTWNLWKKKITISSGGDSGPAGKEGLKSTPTREKKIKQNYQKILGRQIDPQTLQTYLNSFLSDEEIIRSFISSPEHQNILDMASKSEALSQEVENLQAGLGLINEKLINLSDDLVEKDQQVTKLKLEAEKFVKKEAQIEDISLLEACIAFYKFLLPAGKAY